MDKDSHVRPVESSSMPKRVDTEEKDEVTPTEHVVLMRFMMANFKKVDEQQEGLRQQVGQLSVHVTGAAIAVQRLANLMSWAAVMVVAVFVLCLFTIEYRIHSEATQNLLAHQREAEENGKLREEIWGVISLLVTKQCGMEVSGNTYFPLAKPETQTQESSP